MNILYEFLPNSVTVNEIDYPVITDYREWVRFSDLMQTDELSQDEKSNIALQWFMNEVPEDIPKAIIALGEFYCMNEIQIPTQSQGKKKNNKPVMSFEYDAPVIISGFMECYGIDLVRTKHMHWWKFKSLLDGLSKDTEYKERIGYRSVKLSDIKNKEEKKRIRAIQQRIALPSKQIADNEIGSAFSQFM